MNILKSITDSEQQKYERIWKAQNYRSRSAQWFLDNSEVKEGKCLDIGCGDGYVVNGLVKKGIDCYGCDITLAGIRDNGSRFWRCPAWDTGYLDDEFDMTFSMDVLEHIPEFMIGVTLKEIERITSQHTIHIIATFPDHQYQGMDVHLTVRPIQWWAEQFKRFVKVKTTLIERTGGGWKKWQ